MRPAVVGPKDPDAIPAGSSQVPRNTRGGRSCTAASARRRRGVLLDLRNARCHGRRRGPVSESRVFTGYLRSSARSGMGPVQVDLDDLAALDVLGHPGVGMCAGGLQLLEEHPSAVILPRAWRSAEHDTRRSPTGHDAPWRGRRITRTSWQKYLPPNCAPMPKDWVSLKTRPPASRSRKPLPAIEPPWAVCRGSAPTRTLAVLSANPPTSRRSRRRPGGTAACRGTQRADLLVEEPSSRLGLRIALVSWNRKDLLALLPPWP